MASGEQLWDTKLSRFGARRRLASITYVVKVRIDGRQRWIKIGRHGPLTPDQARAKAKLMLAEVDSGRDPARDRERRRTMPTLAKFAETRLVDHVELKRKPSTSVEYKRIVKRHIVPALGLVPVDQIDGSDVLRLHADLARHRYQANRVLAVLSSIMSHAERAELRPRLTNPCRGLERFGESKRKRPLTAAELAKLWGYLKEIEATENPYVIAALRLLLLTGMRKREVLTLPWCDVEFEAGIAKLRDAKTGPRDVVLSKAAIAILAAIPRQVGNPFVICGDRPGRYLVNLNKSWDKFRRHLGFPDVRVHDLRHTVASLLAHKAPLVVVRDALGHQIIETTSGYSHTANDAVRAAVDDLALQISGLAA
jgi:integrase